MSLRPATHAPGSPPATILAKLDRSGRTPNAHLRAALRRAESGDHLVEDQQRAVLLGDSRRSSCANSAPSGTWPNDEPVGS